MKFFCDYSALVSVWLGGGNKQAIREGSKAPGEWVFTFDDGPEPGTTVAVADALEEAGGRGTFFVIGEKVRKEPGIVRDLVNRGHQVETHSMSHARCSRLDRKALKGELSDSKKLLEDITGREVRWFRPPFGALRFSQLAIVAEMGLRIAFWNVNPKDWMGAGPERLAARLELAKAKHPLVVMHDRLPTVGSALRLFFCRHPKIRPVLLR